MKISKIGHTGITVKNMEESIKFYTEIMGFKLIEPPCEMVTDEEEGLAMLGEKGVTHRICMLEVKEGDYIELVEFGNPSSPVDAPLPLNTVGTHHLSYEVDNLQEWKEHLEKSGLHFNYKALPYVTEKGTAWWAMFKDPDGVTIELMQP